MADRGEQVGAKNRLWQWLAGLCALLVVIGGWTAYSEGWFGGDEEPEATIAVQPTAVEPIAPKMPMPPAPVEPPIDESAVRARTWKVAGPLVEKADHEAQLEINKAVQRIEKFFRERRQGSRPFAEAIMSLKGKWKFVRSKLPRADTDDHFKFLVEQFEEHLFAADELRGEVHGALAEYSAAVRAIENRLLVRLRADVTTADPLARRVLPELASDAAFGAEFAKLLERVASQTNRVAKTELIGKNLGWDVIGNLVMEEVARKVLGAVLARLATTAGFATTGAASGTVTFGLGIVVMIVADITFDWIMRQTGNDGVSRVASKVTAEVDEIGHWLVDGLPDAVRRYDTLRRLEREHSDLGIRTASKTAADSIAVSGNLGLRRALMRIHNERRELREAALRKFFLNEG